MGEGEDSRLRAFIKHKMINLYISMHINVHYQFTIYNKDFHPQKWVK